MAARFQVVAVVSLIALPSAVGDRGGRSATEDDSAWRPPPRPCPRGRVAPTSTDLGTTSCHPVIDSYSCLQGLYRVHLAVRAIVTSRPCDTHKELAGLRVIEIVQIVHRGAVPEMLVQVGIADDPDWPVVDYDCSPQRLAVRCPD
jgi:hypothetical protein